MGDRFVRLVVVSCEVRTRDPDDLTEIHLTVHREDPKEDQTPFRLRTLTGGVIKRMHFRADGPVAKKTAKEIEALLKPGTVLAVPALLRISRCPRGTGVANPNDRTVDLKQVYIVLTRPPIEQSMVARAPWSR